MPRFYFHLRDDISAEDPEGAELPDLQAACARARNYAVDMAAASVRELHKIVLDHQIDVADQSGEILCTVKFGDVVAVES